MGDGIYAALSGAVAQETALEATATNLANASTAGYQGTRAVFREVASRGGPNANVRFAAAMDTALDTERGAIRETGNALDVVMPDKGYLVAKTARGDRYTRAGSMTLGSKGVLETHGHDPLLGDNGKPIQTTPGVAVEITPTGEVKSGGAVVGRLRMVTFAKPELLKNEGGGLLAAGPEAGTPSPSAGLLTTGAVEESNASPIRGMTELIGASRLFDAFQRAIEAFHEADRKATSTVPGVG
jgi:flagellar basal body rod protein FlgG